MDYLAIPDGPGKCDFCAAPKPTWAYPARNFLGLQTPDITWGSDGGWAACEQCHKLIEADAYQTLLHRSVQAFEIDNGMTANPAIIASVAALHENFKACRTGPPERIEREPEPDRDWPEQPPWEGPQP